VPTSAGVAWTAKVYSLIWAPASGGKACFSRSSHAPRISPAGIANCPTCCRYVCCCRPLLHAIVSAQVSCDSFGVEVDSVKQVKGTTFMTLAVERLRCRRPTATTHICKPPVIHLKPMEQASWSG
jgi:hypothetical protein